MTRDRFLQNKPNRHDHYQTIATESKKSFARWPRCAYLRGGETSVGVLWDEAFGEGDCFLAGGEVPLEGDDTLPERSSDVNDRLALWELSDRSLCSSRGILR